MKILTSSKWLVKQYTHRIVLLVFLIFLLQVYLGSFTPAKDYILKLVNRGEQPGQTPSARSNATVSPIFKAIPSQVQPTTVVPADTLFINTLQQSLPSLDKSPKDQARVTVFDLNAPLVPVDIYSNIQCRKSIKVHVSTTLCVHDLFRDVHVSGDIMNNGVWEKEILG